MELLRLNARQISGALRGGEHRLALRLSLLLLGDALPSRNGERLYLVPKSGKPASRAKGVRVLGSEGGRQLLEVQSGTYEFEGS